MDSVSYGGGGSSLTSNLSALSPPFIIDKSMVKSNSNGLTNFTEVPYISPHLDLSAPIWHHCSYSNSQTNYVATEPRLNTTFPPPSNTYGFPSTRYGENSPSFSAVSSAPMADFNLFSYDQCSNGMPPGLVEAKPFYPPYVSPQVHHDGMLEARYEPGYDLLSNSGAGQLHGSAQVEYTQSRPAVEYTPSWNGFWGGLNDAENRKWLNIGGSFGAKDHTLFGTSTCTSYVKEATSAPDCLGKYGKASASVDNSFDLFGKEYHLRSPYIKLGDGKTPLDLNAISASNFSIPSAFDSAFACKEIPHHQKPVPDTFTNYCSSQVASNETPEKTLNPSHATVSEWKYVTEDLPVTMRKVPPAGGNSSWQNTLSSIKVNSISKDAFDENTGFAACSSSNLKEPHPPADTKAQSVQNMQAAHCLLGLSDKAVEEIIGIKIDEKGPSDHLWKTNSESQESHQNSSDPLKSRSDDVRPLHSLEKSSGGSDPGNPAVDSPCWRGFSPFDTPDFMDQHFRVKTLDAFSSLDTQNPRSQSPVADTANAIHVSENVEESPCPERPLVADYLSKEQNGSGSINQKLCSSQPNGEDVSQFVNATNEQPTTECNGTNSHPGEKATLKLCESSGNDSTSKIDVHMVVNTMKHLSELLRFHCSGTLAKVTEEDLAVLKDIITNLNGLVGQQGEPDTTAVLSGQCASMSRELSDSQMGAVVSETKAVFSAAGTGKPDCESVAQDKMKDSFVVNNEELFVKDTANAIGESKVTQGIKKVLDENLPGKEEADPQRLLYRNLWLEAESSLCAIITKSRFHRMKEKVEQTTQIKTKGGELNSNFCPVGQAVESAPAFKDSPSANASDCEHLKFSGDSKAFEKIQSYFLNSHLQSVDETKLEETQLQNNEASILARSHVADPTEHEGHWLQKKEIGGPFTFCASSDISSDESHANDFETSVTSRYQILKCRDSQMYDDSLQNSTASLVSDDCASVLARFNILKNRIEKPESMNNPETELGENGRRDLRTGVEDGAEEPVWSQHGSTLIGSKFPTHPGYLEPTNVKELDILIKGVPKTRSCKGKGLSTVPSGAGYEYDSLASDWEHV